MKMNDLGTVETGAARPLPVHHSSAGRHGFLEVLIARLMRKWIGLYAAPPRHLPPTV